MFRTISAAALTIALASSALASGAPPPDLSPPKPPVTVDHGFIVPTGPNGGAFGSFGRNFGDGTSIGGHIIVNPNGGVQGAGSITFPMPGG